MYANETTGICPVRLNSTCLVCVIWNLYPQICFIIYAVSKLYVSYPFMTELILAVNYSPVRQHNPFSMKPGGFMRGAGHGSTVEDKNGAWWHAATMQISMNHSFERRVGLWRAGFDRDGELFCNQRYGDWPVSMERLMADPWAEPEW